MEVVIMQERMGRYKQLLVLGFNSSEELTEYAENANRNKRETGIVTISLIEGRVLEKAAHLIERKAKKQHERQIALSDERSFSSIMEMFLK